MRRSLPLLFLASIITTSGCVTRNSSELQPQPQQPATVISQSPSTSPCLLPVPENHVTDHANILDQAAREALEGRLRNVKTKGNIDFSVVLIDTSGSQDINSYSLDLARCWGVGAKNSDGAGVLLLLAIKDRKWRFQISKVLEQVITNSEVYDIGNLMTPDLKRANYALGVNKAVDGMIAALAKRRGFSLT